MNMKLFKIVADVVYEWNSGIINYPADIQKNKNYILYIRHSFIGFT